MEKINSVLKLSVYETKVLKLMLKSEFNHQEITEICQSTPLVYEFTEGGYFLQLRNNLLLATDKEVISQPIITGHTKTHSVSFILFISHNLLTIECHSLGVENPPRTIRQQGVVIKQHPKREK